MRRTVTFLTLVAALLAGCSSKSQSSSPGATSLPKGIDTAGMDTVGPARRRLLCLHQRRLDEVDDDSAGQAVLWRYQHPRRSDAASRRSRSSRIPRTPVPSASADARKIGDFYSSFMDEAGIESKGTTPLKPQLDAIAAIARYTRAVPSHRRDAPRRRRSTECDELSDRASPRRLHCPGTDRSRSQHALPAPGRPGHAGP